nr:hypothetical protein [Treponemataceae bacterium]
MEAVWEWGINFIKDLQTISCKPLDAIAFFIHYVFNTPIYILLMLIICWIVDMHKGIKIGSTLLISCSINGAIKDVLKAPRPYQYSSSNFNADTYVPGKGIVDYSDSPVFRIEEGGYSTPSGH